MSTEAIEDINIASAALTNAYENKWVALSRDHRKVIASAETLIELDRQIKDHATVIYTRVLPKNVVFAPTSVCG